MEIIILGFVLFILGVGATIIYDKQKEAKSKRSSMQELGLQKARAIAAERAETLAKSRKSQKNIIEQLLGNTQIPMYTSKTTTKTTKTPIRQKKVLKSETVTADDGSINSSLTVQELIAKIENMKKK